MANLNLSEFTEKLFVADADHTFIWDSAASISKRVSRNSWLNSGTLTSDAPVTISQTWNNAAVAFTGLKVNATSTASANGSLFLDLQLGGVSQFKIDRNSHIFVSNANSRLDININNVPVAAFFAGGLMRTYGSLGFSDPTTFPNDLILTRDGAGQLALRNGAAAQTFNVYGTYTSGTSYERLTLSAPSAANAIIGTNKGSGGGTARGLDLHTDGAARMTITTAGNVGIGTTAPGAKLDIVTNGNDDGIKITNTSSSSSRLSLYNSSSNLAYFCMFGSGVSFGLSNSASFGSQNSIVIASDAQVLSGGTNSIQFRAGGYQADQERMRITAAGNVGIGTTSPTSKLHVAGELGSNTTTYDTAAGIRLTNTTSNNSWIISSGVIGASNSRFCIRETGAADPSLIISGTNIGLGTVSPTARLHVAGTIKPEQATMVDKAAGFTLAAVDAGTVINSTSATAITINLPAADTAAGYNVMIIQSGAGAVTIAANGNTLNSFGSAFTTAGQHAACSIVRTAASTYNLSGNLV